MDDAALQKLSNMRSVRKKRDKGPWNHLLIGAFNGRAMADHLKSQGFHGGWTNALYAVQAYPPDGLVRIGRSSNPFARWVSHLCEFPEFPPLRIITMVSGGANYEPLVHVQLAEHRHHSEWFSYCDAIESLSSVATVDALEAWLKPTTDSLDTLSSGLKEAG